MPTPTRHKPGFPSLALHKRARPTDQQRGSVLLHRVAADLSTNDDIDSDDIEPGINACVQLALSTPTVPTRSSLAPAELNVHALGMNLHAATVVGPVPGIVP